MRHFPNGICGSWSERLPSDQTASAAVVEDHADQSDHMLDQWVTPQIYAASHIAAGNRIALVLVFMAICLGLIS